MILELVIRHPFCYQHFTYCIIYNICKGILPHDLFFFGGGGRKLSPLLPVGVSVSFCIEWKYFGGIHSHTYLTSTVAMCFQLLSHFLFAVDNETKCRRHLVVLKSPPTKTKTKCRPPSCYAAVATKKKNQNEVPAAILLCSSHHKPKRSTYTRK